ncbi:MAG: polyprenyl synthetase family protein [Methanotrichaceae archaeon]
MFEGWDEYHLINKGLKKLADSLPGSDLGMVINYVLSSSGKRVRPLILIFSSESFGGDASKSMKAALAVELVHAASLIHDDILDNGIKRRGVPCTSQKYGTEAALLCGDYLISKSIELISDYSQPVIENFAKACMEMSEGEMLDMSSRSEFEDYYLCICKKTASIFAASAKIGGLIAGADENDVALFESYGMHLGLAYQIVDDLKEYLGIDEGKISRKTSVTLPVIYNKDYPVEVSLRLCTKAIQDHCCAAKNALAEAGGNKNRKGRLDCIVDKMTAVWGDECKLLKNLC